MLLIALYCFGTAVTVMAVIYELVDSFGGLMYAKKQRYFVQNSAASVQLRLLLKRRDDDL